MSAMIRSGSDVSQLGTIMGVWAHPDDEAYLSAGLMALARDAGSAGDVRDRHPRGARHARPAGLAAGTARHGADPGVGTA